MDPRTRRRQKKRRRKKLERWRHRRDSLRAMLRRIDDNRDVIAAAVKEHIEYQLSRPPSLLSKILPAKEKSDGARSV